MPEPLPVSLTDDGFSPDHITVSVGQSIVMRNDTGATRTITSGGDGTFDSGPVAPGSRYVLSFPSPGTWHASDDAAPANTATITVGLAGLEGDQFTSASSAIPDTMPADAPVVEHPTLGIEVTRNRILVAFTQSATVPQANAALAAAGLTIVGGNREMQILATEVGDTGDPTLAHMQAALDSLRADPAVRTAAFDVTLNPESAIPRPAVPDPGLLAGSDPYTWESLWNQDGSVIGIGTNYGLEAARFPQAWNWLDAIRNVRPVNSAASATVVLDVGFQPTHPDLQKAELHENLCLSDGRCTTNDPDPHGTATAAIIGAAFNRGPAGATTSQGVVGGDPVSDLHLVPLISDEFRDSNRTVGFLSFVSVIDLIMDARPTAFPNLRVINLSAGTFFTDDANGITTFEKLYGNAPCGPGADDDATAPDASKVPCTPNNKDSYLAEFRALAQLLRPVDALLGGTVLLVVAAGNDSTKICAGAVRVTRSDPCPSLATIDAANIDPFAYLEDTWSPGSPPPWVLVESNFTTPDAFERPAYSNVGGTISAPGGRFARVGGEVIAQGSAVPVVTPSGPGYHVLVGTSMAAPFVSAAAGLLMNLTPDPLTVRRLLVDRGPIDVPGSTTPRLDVFASMLGLPGISGIDALLDVNDTTADGNLRVTRDDHGNPTGENRVVGGPRTEWSVPDGRVDMRDFRRLRDGWLQTCAATDTGCPPPSAISIDGSATHPKRDLNVDGCLAAIAPNCAGENLYPRLDFNGDGFLSLDPFPVLIDDNGSPTARGNGNQMTDVDVFATRFGQGPNAETEGWSAGDLDRLMVSADVELRLDHLWEQGVASADVRVSTVDTSSPWRTFAPRGPGDVRVATMPIDPIAEAGNPLNGRDLIQVRVHATMADASNSTFLSPPITVGSGQDVVVVPCTDQFTVTAGQNELPAGGTTMITATLQDCTGRPVANEAIDFEIVTGPNGSSITVVNATTDAAGRAQTVFDYPDGASGLAAINAYSYPALDGDERLTGSVVINAATEVAILYRYRQTILDYTRTSTNDWGPGEDDCDGPNDAGTSSVKCFTATQTIAPERSGAVVQFNDPITGPYWGLGDTDVTLGTLERSGTITPNGTGGVTIDEQVSSRQIPTEAIPPDAPTQEFEGIEIRTQVSEWDPGDPANPSARSYSSDIVADSRTGGQVFPGAVADLAPVDDDTVTIGADGNTLRVDDLRIFADVYGAEQFLFTWDGVNGVLPPETNQDLPLPVLYAPTWQLPTDLAFVPRADGTNLMWDDNPDAPLEFTINADGTYDPVSWCSTRERVFGDGTQPGYWNDTDPSLVHEVVPPWGESAGAYTLRDPDSQNPTRRPGDRAAPRQSGSIRSRFEFVAAVTAPGDPAPELEFPSCTDTDATPLVGWTPDQPVEGQDVAFENLSSYDADSIAWRFADPAGDVTATGYRFSDNGTYAVDFTLTDTDGKVHNSEVADVVVANAPPTLGGLEFLNDGRAIRMLVDDPGPIDRQQLQVTLTSPTPGWPAGGVTSYTSAPSDPPGPWTHTVSLPDNLTPGVYFVVLSVLDKDGAKVTASFSLAVSPPAASPGGPSPLRAAPSRRVATPVGAFMLPEFDLVAQAAPPASPPPVAPVPAFVIDTVAVGTGELVTVVNRTRSGGVPAAATLDPGDGRPGLAIAALATIALAYPEAGSPVLGLTAAGGTGAGVDVAVTGASIPANVAYSGDLTAPLGAAADVVAHVTRGDGSDLPGAVIEFALGAVSVQAVSDTDGIARTELAVTGATGARDLVVRALPNGAPTTIAFTVTSNEVPIADAGGPYSVGVGSPLVLTGTAGDADPGETATLAYQWDLDGDGKFDDAAGPEASLSAAMVSMLLCRGTCEAGEVSTVALRVTDVKGGRAIDTATVTSVRDFALSINPQTAVLVPNANVSFTVSVLTANGFAGPVSLTAPGLPAGVTATFDPPTVTPNGTSLLTLRAGATITDDDFTLVVRGTSGTVVREIGTAMSLDFGLVPQCYGAVAGRVTHEVTGAGLAGVAILGVTTGADGSFSATNLGLESGNAPRMLFLSSFGTDFWPLSPQASVRIACGVTSRLDIELLPREYGAIGGTITGVAPDGTPLGPVANAEYALNQRTGADGRYSLTQLVLGEGNAPRSQGVSVRAPNFHPAAASVEISAGTTSTLDIAMRQVCTGGVRVRVLDQRTGKPVPEAQVDFGPGTGGGGVTDANGVIVLTGVELAPPNNGPIGRTIRARTPSAITPQGVATRSVTIGSCGATAPLDIAIPFPQRVEAAVDVLVVDDTGAPVPDATVRIGGISYTTQRTGADGRVTITHLLGYDVAPTLSTAVTAFAANMLSPSPMPLTLTAGQPNSATVTLVRRRYGAAEGVVRDRATGEPIAGVRVEGITTGPDGRYRIEQIGLNGINEPRQYNVSAFDPRTPPLYWAPDVQPITVAADVVTQVPDLLMTRICAPATIRGRVVNAVTGAPIDTASVTAGSVNALTNSDGRFVLAGLGLGTNNRNLQYRVTASKAGFITAHKDVTVSCGADITVDFGTDADGAGTISGTVTDSDGNPVTGAQITTGFGGAATTGGSGQYTIPNAPAGPGGTSRDWVVLVQPPSASQLDSASATATVTRDQTTTVDFVLGTLTDDPPVAASFALTIEPAPVAVTLAGADPTNDPLTFAVTAGPDNGELTGTAPNLVYTPNPGFAGVDTITYAVSDGTNTSASATITITVLGVNVAPVAVITGLAAAPEGTWVDLSAVASSDDGVITSYEWDLDADGTYDDDTDVTARVRLRDDGTITVGLRVTDDRGGVGTTTRTVEFTNVAPELDPFDPEVEGSFVMWFGDIDDPGLDTFDGTVDFGDGTGPRPLTEDEVGGDFFGVSHDYAAAGTYSISLNVCDDDGGCASAATSVTTTGTGNAAPTARITGPTAAAEGGSVELSAVTSSDPDGTIEMAMWDLDGDGNYGEAGEAGLPAVTVTSPDDAVISVGLRVFDDDGAAATTTHSVTFANVAPTIPALAPVSIVAGAAIAVDGSFLDPGADDWTATVDWADGNGPVTLALAGKGFVLARTFATAGSYAVTISVCDDDEGCGSQTLTVDVTAANRPPVASIAAPSTVAEGTAVTFDGTGSSDPDGTVAAWAWDLDGDDEYDDATTPSVTRVCLDDSVLAVGLRVVDNDGAPATTTASVTCTNVSPAVAALVGGALEPGDTYTASGSFSDPGADSWTATVDWGEGTAVEPLALVGQSFVLTHAFVNVGVFDVAVKVCDDDGGCHTVTASVRVAEPPPDPTADLSIDKHHAGDFTIGAAGSYTIDVTNAGPDVAQGVVVTDTLPAGVTFAGSSSAGWTCTEPTAGTVSCALANGLAVDAAAPPLVLGVAVDATAGAGSVVNTASVSAQTPDPGTAPNSDDDPTVLVEPPPPSSDLAATVVVSKSNPAPGDVITWTITVTNDGPDASGAVRAEVDVPDGLTFGGIVAPSGLVRQAAPPWTCGGAAPLVCTTSTLAPSANAVLALWFTVDADASGELVGEVRASGPNDDPDPSDNTRPVALVVAQVPPTSTTTTTTTTTTSTTTTTTTTGPTTTATTPTATTTSPSTPDVGAGAGSVTTSTPPLTPSGELPVTGANSTAPLPIALVLLALGVALATVTRCRVKRDVSGRPGRR